MCHSFLCAEKGPSKKRKRLQVLHHKSSFWGWGEGDFVLLFQRLKSEIPRKFSLVLRHPEFLTRHQSGPTLGPEDHTPGPAPGTSRWALAVPLAQRPSAPAPVHPSFCAPPGHGFGPSKMARAQTFPSYASEQSEETQPALSRPSSYGFSYSSSLIQ